MGGQNHILCSMHDLPLIISIGKNTHVRLAETSFIGAVQLIAWLVFSKDKQIN